MPENESCLHELYSGSYFFTTKIFYKLLYFQKDALNQLEEAKAESFQVTQQSRDQIKKFENKRLVDLKEGLESFFRIEIAKHAKSLELLTEAYKYIHSIDEHGDLEVRLIS